MRSAYLYSIKNTPTPILKGKYNLIYNISDIIYDTAIMPIS